MKFSENTVMFIAVIAIVVIVEIVSMVGRRTVKSTSYPAMCFVISSDDLTGYEPATWIERHGLKNLVKRMVLHKCTSEVDGKQVESEILVPWVKQRGIEVKDTH